MGPHGAPWGSMGPHVAPGGPHGPPRRPPGIAQGAPGGPSGAPHGPQNARKGPKTMIFGNFGKSAFFLIFLNFFTGPPKASRAYGSPWEPIGPYGHPRAQTQDLPGPPRRPPGDPPGPPRGPKMAKMPTHPPTPIHPPSTHRWAPASGCSGTPISLRSVAWTPPGPLGNFTSEGKSPL